ncbi:MAG: hypothetical protein HKP58_14475 [Desulfatitalea sp.]|nr:hypothetical protein [Desulfatitalea sp.]NNK01611.1 hypothetical protein [Desulfatitalea sp.]
MKVRITAKLLRSVMVFAFFLGIETSFFLMPVVSSAEMKIPADLFSVDFVSDAKGWACGRWGTIIHTADGGNSWTYQKSLTDYTLSSISFADARHGWAVGDGGTILHTQDGGQTWKKQANPSPVFLMGVTFVTPKKGWAVGERTTIVHTMDGGQTWQVQFSGEDFILRAVSFADELNGWAVGEYGFIYNTKDGGASWTQQGGKFEISMDTGDIIAGNYLFDVSAVDGDRAWAVGIEGHVIRTADGGQTWQVMDTGIVNSHLLAVAVDKSGHILIAGKGLMIYSNDNAARWHHSVVTPSIEYGWLAGLASKEGAGFSAVGRDGCVYLGDREGKAWVKATH